MGIKNHSKPVYISSTVEVPITVIQAKREYDFVGRDRMITVRGMQCDEFIIFRIVMNV